MKKSLMLILLLTGALLFAACSQKKITSVEPSQPEQAAAEQKDAVTKAGQEAQTAGIPQEKAVEQQLPARDAKTTEILAQTKKQGLFEFKDVPFDYDRYSIRQDARAALDSTAEWLKNNKDIKITIEGHCDERGTNEYNLALGERRAKTVRDYLSSLGISSGRMNFVTFGEEKPLCAAANEQCWQENRRAHIVTGN